MNPEIFELQLHQELHLHQMESAAKGMSRKELEDIAVQMARLIMVKDNIIRELVKEAL